MKATLHQQETVTDISDTTWQTNLFIVASSMKVISEEPIIIKLFCNRDSYIG